MKKLLFLALGLAPQCIQAIDSIGYEQFYASQQKRYQEDCKREFIEYINGFKQWRRQEERFALEKQMGIK